MRSTKPGMPSTVGARSSSSLYAGMTTATRLPSSTRLRLDGSSADDPRRGLPDERREDAEHDADQSGDENRVAAASSGRLRRTSRRDQLALLDVLGEREQLLVLGEVGDDLPLLLDREPDLVREQQALDRRKAGVLLYLCLQRGDPGVDALELGLVRRDIRLEVLDLGRDVAARDLADRDVRERVGGAGDLRRLLAVDDDVHERVLADAAERGGNACHRLRRDMAAERAARQAGLLLGPVLPEGSEHHLLDGGGIRAQALDL